MTAACLFFVAGNLNCQNIYREKQTHTYGKRIKMSDIKKTNDNRKRKPDMLHKRTAKKPGAVHSGGNKNSRGGKSTGKKGKTYRRFLPWDITEKTIVIAGKTIKALWLFISALILIAVILIGIGFHIFNNMYDEARKSEYTALSHITDNTFKETGKTYIYDKDGNTITVLHNTGYRYTPINEISDALQRTYISSEDKEFLTHNGFSIKGIGRAAVSLFKSGRITQGGSTITQQLVKNTLLSNERTFFRKLTEVFLAVDLEKKYTKADIMEYYLNTCFYGNNCKGIYAASEYYFGKKPSEIGYDEAAMLAAISKSPSIYNPEADLKTSIKERNIVLKSLLNDQLITADEYKEYSDSSYKIREHETKEEKKSYESSFAIYCATLKLMEADGFKFEYRFADKKSQTSYEKKYKKAYLKYSNMLRNGGYKIYTSFDPAVQKILQSDIDKKLLSISTETADDGRYNTQGAATVIDNSTGYITALVGGRGTDDEYNRAFLSERQPGSSIKPVLDYGPAFDTGLYFPGRKVSDVKSKNGPKNSEGTYKGMTTVREAIASSRNTVAYDTLNDIGLDTGLSYLSAMRFSSLSYLDEYNLSASIGGFTYGVKNYELAGAYAAIENGGAWREPTCVTEIRNIMTGTDIKDKRKGMQVYKDSSAFMLTSTMEDVIKSGTGKGLAVKDMHCAGKTGTTNSLKDGWFAGFTPYYTCTVWVGNDDGTAVYKNYGAKYAGLIWKDVMNTLHKDLPDRDFIQPDSVVKQDGDYVAVEKEEVSIKVNRDAEIEEENKAAEKAVKKYEDFYIEEGDDIYRRDDVRNAAEAAIADVSDDDSRNAFLKRLSEKDDELDAEASKWKSYTKTKEEYEAEKEQKAREKAVEEQQQRTEENRLNNAIKRFEDAVSIINDAEEYSQAVDDALSVAEENLEDLKDLDDYSSYKDEYTKAKERVDTLIQMSQGSDTADDTEEGDE